MPTYDHGVAGLTGTIGVTVLNADGTVHDARTTTGITEPVAGSGIYHFAHPHPGTLLLFVFDGGVGTVGGSVYDDGLSTVPARAGDAMTLTTAERTAVKDAVEAGASMTALTTRLTATRAGYLDALDSGVPLTASYDSSKYAVMSTVWTDTKAGYLDAAVTSRAAAATALSTATWTDAKAGYLTGNVALAASLSTANTNIAAVLADTGTDGVVVATASKNAIADAVWDEAVSDHVTAGTAGRFLQRVYRYFFNKRTHTNSAVTVYADDGTTADATMVVSGDTTTVTKAAPS